MGIQLPLRPDKRRNRNNGQLFPAEVNEIRNQEENIPTLIRCVLMVVIQEKEIEEYSL